MWWWSHYFSTATWSFSSFSHQSIQWFHAGSCLDRYAPRLAMWLLLESTLTIDPILWFAGQQLEMWPLMDYQFKLAMTHVASYPELSIIDMSFSGASWCIFSNIRVRNSWASCWTHSFHLLSREAIVRANSDKSSHASEVDCIQLRTCLRARVT